MDAVEAHTVFAIILKVKFHLTSNTQLLIVCNGSMFSCFNSLLSQHSSSCKQLTQSFGLKCPAIEHDVQLCIARQDEQFHFLYAVEVNCGHLKVQFGPGTGRANPSEPALTTVNDLCSAIQALSWLPKLCMEVYGPTYLTMHLLYSTWPFWKTPLHLRKACCCQRRWA